MSERNGLEIAIIGLAGRFPGAKDVRQFWENLRCGVESIERFSDEELSAAGVAQELLANPSYVKAGTVIEGADLLDAEFFSLTPREAEIIDPQHRLFLECAWEALEVSGYDPETYRRPIGVYAGVSFSTYVLLNVWSNRDRLEFLGSLLGADKDHLATLVSYKLNLEGPSLAVQTACSTSLVAVHLAAQGLLNGECDLALAGGVSLRFPQRSGYFWTEGGILSPDGHCRAFDAESGGTVFGDGLGIVVLKRLEDAEADGDTIHAVIKGSAINNDGAAKVGYTAPRMEGQTKVIRAAQIMAEVEPDSLGYVEAHGTGTALGDPIEVAALTEAFRAGTDRRGFCALGSVKTNIGHLNAASGIAGLIKTVLALKHRTIPPSLHFERPNPQIDFAASPFVVSAEARDWPAGDLPRRAGVSSFGMGGTNAHVIVEEAPPAVATGPSRACQMLVLSARSAEALEAATDGLAAHLSGHPGEALADIADIADIAYTLHRGRHGFGHRRVLLASSREAAARALSARDPQCVLTAAGGERERPVHFLFPGQGAQHVDMARGLYETEPVFRQEVDRSAELLEARLGCDLREILWPPAQQASAAAQRLEQTAITQPALFVVEYALARLWMSWGVRPRGMLGHSIGEYVAACLAGVFTLEEALALVALRGRLIQELPGGAMLAVPLSAERLEPLLGERVALAAVNGPALCVVSGSREDVGELRRKIEPLLGEGVLCRPLRTSHAFHSAAMDPILGAFGEALRSIALKAPSLPFVSNVTGKWITAAEATDPTYWVRQLRQTVRFADGLRSLLAADAADVALLEVGPGRTLSTLARQHPALASRPATAVTGATAVPAVPAVPAVIAVIASLRHPQDQQPDQETLLRALGQLWLSGARVDWQGFYAGERRRRIPLPTYPFERRRYWIEPKPETAIRAPRAAAPALTEEVKAAAPPQPAKTLHPRPSLGTAFVPPASRAERAIAALWQDLFGIAEIGVHDDFYDLGGHSLLVTQMASRVRDVAGVELPLRVFFEERTVARLAAIVERQLAESAGWADTFPQAPPLLHRSRDLRSQELPLSFAQQRLWLLDQLAPGNPFYNLSGAIRIEGELRVDALCAALREVVRRHATLRTSFGSEGGKPVQRIEPAVGLDLPVVDLCALPVGKRQTRTDRLAAGLARQPFDLALPPLLRVVLLRLQAAEHVLVFSMHHIVSDGWSMGVLTGEVAHIYDAFTRGEPSPLPELAIQYADFALWQRGWLQGKVLEAQLAYWRERLAGAPVVELPADRPRPPVQSFRGATHWMRLSAERLAVASALAREHGVTLFMALLAAFKALVLRYTGEDDVVVGTPIANRTRSELEGLIGCFVNSLVLRTDLGGDPVGEELLARVRETTLGAFAHQDLPFEYLVEKLEPQRDMSRNPLFQLMFNLVNTPQAQVESGELRIASLAADGETALFDLQVYIHEASSGLSLVWEYSTDLFKAATIERLAGHFAIVLQGLATRPGGRLSQLPLLTPREQRQLLVDWNATRRPLSGLCLHEGIAARAAFAPEAVAVTCGDQSLTYGELDRRANDLACELRELGVGPEVRVGIALERSVEMVVGLLAVLKAGGAYVPLDPFYPEERLALMREDAGLTLVLESLPQVAERSGAVDSGVGPENVAYVIYTSGSTGRPKGVEISHGALMNFLTSMAERPGLRADDTLLAVTSLSFDIAGLELYLPLLVGGRVVVASREEAADGRRVQELLARFKATVLQATPATWRLLLDSGWQGAKGLKALCGGEALPPALAMTLRPLVGSLWNLYGPTETTVWSTVEQIRGDGPVFVGRPIANTEAHVVDGSGSLAPPGAPGELLLGGAGLARGYLARPDLTAERFVPNAFGEVGSRLYRTGDLARWRPAGVLECLGRIDHQVKVRGFRIELGEIEMALARHPEVAAAVVVAAEEASGERRLVAYLVPREGVGGAGGESLTRDLRTALNQSLPDYMVPTAWVQLAALPLTPNGKVDRKALPAPEPLARMTGASTVPRTPVEEMLAGIWAQVLNLGVGALVGAEDNFFELGGHSLLATQVISRVREAFAVELPLRRVFETPTLAGLARTLEAARREGSDHAVPALVRSPREGDLPLSFGQQRLWFLDRLDPESPAYNISAAVRLLGRLDLQVLAATLDEVVRRHEVLRTTFRATGREPVQEIHPPGRFALALADLSGLPAAGRAAEAQELTLADLRQPFDLAGGPLARATVVRVGEEEHLLLFAMHHIVTDGWSMGLLVREVGALYPAFAAGRASQLPELPIQYADYAVWQRSWLKGEALTEQVDYWRERLAGAPALLRLATDRPRPAVQRFLGARFDAWLPPDAIVALKRLGQRQGTTLFMTLLAAFAVLLKRHSGEDDVVVGSPAANRDRAELEGLIGFFVNTLVLRVDLSGDPAVDDLLGRVRDVALGAYAHQSLPFEKLVEELKPERSLAHSPLFQVMLVLQNAPTGELNLPGLTLRPEARPHEISKFDLTLTLTEGGDELLCQWRYNTELFDEATVARQARHLENLVVALAAAADAEADTGQRLAELALLGEAERWQLVAEWSRGEASRLVSRSLDEMVAEQAARRPGAVAIVWDEGELSYGELDREANRLARRLRRLGVGPEVLVGLCAERSPEMVLGLLAVVKAGGAYVPLDPAYPLERLAWLLADSGVPVLLTQERLVAGLPPQAAATSMATVLLEEEPAESAEALTPLGCPENLAYVIYTSGSTGTPKAVLVSHRGLDNLAEAQGRLFELGPDSRVLQFASMSFDASVSEIAMAFRAGAALVLATGRSLLGSELAELLFERRITTVTLPPTVLATLPQADLPALRTLVVAGEACPVDLARRWAVGRRLVNAYGPTETTVCATGFVYDGGERLLLGRPIQNLEAYVLDPAGALAPIRVPGELLVGGIGLARGYRGRPDLTAERFVPHPFATTPGERLYRTGDLVRFVAGGELEFLGRIDHQVKIRGVRVELGEVEAALLARPGVREAVAVVRKDGSGPVRLVAYAVPEAGADLDGAGLRGALVASLPEPLVPAMVVVLESLPLTQNGKVDRKALPAPEGPSQSSSQSPSQSPTRDALALQTLETPKTPLERFLAGLWQDTLGVAHLGIHDDFFALGGNSILGAMFVNRLQQELGEIVHVVVMFDAPTVARLADYLTEHYPQAVTRLFGAEVLGARRSEAWTSRVDEARVGAFRALIPPLVPLDESHAAHVAHVADTGSNPPAVFVLSPPRSGSTLLRVMLGGNPRLFAPPELELLSFHTLEQRRAAFPGRNSFWLEGVTRAVMEIRRCEAEEAAALLTDLEARGFTTRDLYRLMQEWIGGRMLVDKTPSYALDLGILRRAEEVFESPRYVHLLRHPYGMIRSFEEAKLEQVFFRHHHDLPRRELAELIWLVSQRNILEFLAGVPEKRQHRVRFEDLLAEPEAELRKLCDVLEIAYHPDMAEPYKEKAARMTDGIHAWSRMLGDVKFHQHRSIDRSTAERWREQTREDFLSDVTWEMAERLGYEAPRRGAAADGSPIAVEPIEPGRPYPLSFAQERLWILDRMDPGSPAYNIPVGLRLQGRLDVPALAQSLTEIVRRHVVLRSVFAVFGAEPVQVPQPASTVPLPLLDLAGLPAAEREAEAKRLAQLFARQPFDLERGPMLRVILVRLGEEEHGALFTMHHVASDGWSMGVLVREVSTLYAAFSQGEPSPLPQLPLQYVDYARWQREWLAGEVLSTHLAYWRENLAGVPTLQLPTDRPRPRVQTLRGATRGFEVDGETASALKALGQRGGGTLYMSLLAVFAALLERYSGQEDVAVGSPTANRPRPELESLIGFFVNTLVLRTDLSGAPSFEQLLVRVRTAAVGAYAHQDVPFEKVVFELQSQRDLSTSPLFQVMFTMQNVPVGRLTLPGLTLTPLGAQVGAAKFDLSLSVEEWEGGLGGSLEYNRDLFDPATIDRLLVHFRELLAGVVAEPGRSLAQLPLMPAAERDQILVEWNATGRRVPSGCVHEWIAAQAARTPEAMAVAFGGGSLTLTYRQLDRRANGLALRLLELGVGPEVRVGIALKRSPELVVALLAVLKAGGSYVPLDPSYPAERLAFMREDAGLATVLTEESLREIPEVARTPRSGVGADNAAYVIYTSGSTGRPKGVEITHGALANFLAAMAETPGFAAEDTLLAVTSLSFDIAGLELYLPLVVGGRVVLASREEAADGRWLQELIAESGATVLQATPATWRLLLDSGWQGGEGLKALCGGEALSPALAVALRPRVGSLWNVYGPTETTVWSTVEEVTCDGPIFIGRPIANTEAYVLDGAGQPAPAGVSGELLLGGAGLARGYLGRPELTAEKFVPSAFGAPGSRLYRTGDLARWRPGGVLECLGRIDYQVKVRGFRIELGEIEAALGRHPEVAAAVVVAREEASGDRRLVAYVVPRRAGADLTAELQGWVRQSLPEHMVPAVWVSLEELPLTPNGKVDRKALPAPVLEMGDDVAPRTPTEEVLVGIWARVLGLESVGAQDSFFHLGGHSLLATQVVSRVREAFGVELALRQMFETPTLSGLARAIDAARMGDFAAPPLVKVSRQGDLPLSFAQQRLWLLDQLAPGNPFYNLPGALRLHGELNVEALRAAVREVVRRHETLRTGFASVDGTPVQRIDPGLEMELALEDLSDLPREEREAKARQRGAEVAHEPFDLSRPSLLRVVLLKLGEAEHALLFAMHHIVSDNWSLGVLTGEVARLFAAFARGESSPLPQLPVQYADFAVWQRGWLQGEALERQLGYWAQSLAGAPVVELPTDRPRPPMQSFRGATYHTLLSVELSGAVGALSRERGVSPFMVLIATFQSLIARYTGEQDVVVGTPIANRTRAELEGLIGFFVNTLVLRTDLGGDPAVSEILPRVREMALGAYAHQDLPFEYLVERLQPQRDLSRNPLFQLMFNLLNAPVERMESGSLAFSPMAGQRSTALFDLQVYVHETGRGFSTLWEYATDLFDATTMERLARHFGNLLAGLVELPEVRLSQLPLLDAAERDQLLVEWNATARAVPAGCVHEWIAAQAARTPEAVAVTFGDGSLTYRQLDRRANGLALRLLAQGVGPEVRVGIALERSLEMVVALLAVLKAGGAYVPLDPSYPGERLAFMREDSGVAMVLTEESLREGFPEVVRAPGSGVGADNAAYVIYTSGSTGRPKGVEISHGALANFLASMSETPGLTAGDTLLAVTSLSFDIAGLELYLPLVVGGRVALASREEAADGRRLQELIAESGATMLQATPATWRLLLDSGWQGGEGLKALCGGEALAPALAVALRPRVGSLWNVYGPTETTVWSTVEEVTSDRPILIGRPIANTSAYVLDSAGKPSPVGVPGDLLLGGTGLARGYLGRPELTAEKFVPSAFGAPGSRLYRTGDLARWRAGGVLECLGRIDYQVKVRGFRIELGEIEAALGRHSEVAAAVVVLREEPSGDRRLVAYVVAREGAGGESLARDLRAALRQSLPEYMVPTAWVQLAALPLTPNGKVDRKALPAPEPTGYETGGFTAPRTPAEEVLAGIWEQVLGREAAGIDDNFFDLGGHSLLATQVVSRVREAFGVELPLRRIFEAPTLAGLARAVEQLRTAEAGFEVPPIVAISREGELPLSFAQQRMWILDQLEVASTAYHLGTAVRLRGRLDFAALRDALSQVVRRHEALRTTFVSSHGRPLQVVAPPLDVLLPQVDLCALPVQAREGEAYRVTGQMARLRFDLSRGPLLRAILVTLDSEESRFGFTVHHIVADGWSLGILIREVAALYRAVLDESVSPLSPLSPLLPLPVQYADFAAWQRSWLKGEVLDAQLSYWKVQLAELPPVLQLSLDRPRRVARTAPLRRRQVVLPEALGEALRALGRRSQATPFMTLLAGFKTLLHRYTGQRDIPVGTPIANRERLELEGLIGFFANTLVLRTNLAGDPDFLALLARVRTMALDAYAHQDLPFERLVEELQPERDLAVNPLFQVMFQMQNVPLSSFELPGLTLLPVEGEPGAAMFELVLSLRDLGRGFAGSLDYDADLFEATTIERLAGHWTSLLAGVAARPDVPLSELPLLSAVETHQVSAEWSDAAAGFPRQACLHELIAAQAERTPEAVAIGFEGRRLTYRELDEHAGRLAGTLAALGAGPETLVGVCLERSAEMLVALLGVWKAGAAYVPLDPSYPEDRLAYMLEDAGISLLVADGAAPESLCASVARVVSIVPVVPLVPLVPLVPVTGEAGAGEVRPRLEAGPENLAYLIYTSGSTGRPKGVEISHGALVNFMQSMSVQPGLEAADALLAVTSLSFDIASLELFLPLLVGGRIELASREVAGDGARLLALLRDSGATVMQATPVTWHLLIAAGWGGGDGLKALCGGEALPERLAGELCERSDSVWNLYGPTETTVWSAARRLRRQERIAVGPPVANTGLYLLDDGLYPVALGIPGELWIGGLGLARGYRGRCDLTAERFLPDPFAAGPGARMYRTGDLARFRPDGAIELLGRADFQVKVRGFRIELGEIEAVLEAQSEVERAVVVARGEEGNKGLVAYLVPRDSGLSVVELHERLGRSLPDYMVPASFMLLDSLPLTPNGKVDRRALPAPEGGRPELGSVYVAPSSPLEELLAGVWAEALGVERVGVHDNFFTLGGHSLLATQVVSRIGEMLEIDVALRRLFEAPTVAGLAEGLLRQAPSRAELERAAALVLDLLRLSEDEVDALLVRQAANGSVAEVS